MINRFRDSTSVVRVAALVSAAPVALVPSGALAAPAMYSSPEVAADWPQARQQRIDAKNDYIAANQVAFDWFSDFAFSEKDGIPYIMLRLFPEIAPEVWGSADNFLDVVGLHHDPRLPGYPLARGIGFSGLERAEADGDIDYASVTCGACHNGRMQLDDGSHYYLDAGVNTEFNFVGLRMKVQQTLYHLLVPGERPDRFIKGRIGYDQALVGFDWRGDSDDPDGAGYLLDTRAFSAVSNAGHDRDIEVNGRRYKLDRSDDPDGARAIIEYMKTL